MLKHRDIIKNISTSKKGYIAKITVITLTMALVFPVCSSANVQNPESILIPKNLGKSITWDVTVHCSNSGGQTDYIKFGEAPDANDGPPADIYDVVKPPAPQPPYIRAWLNDNLPVPYDSLWMDYRQYPDTSKVWNLTVHWMPSSGSSPTTITLSWNTAEVDNSEYTSVNLCTETGGILQNMLLNSTYTFSCPAYVPQNFKIICSISVNQPPVFGTPTPVNGSTNNPLSLSWSIPINDPEGDLFSWTIQCSNGQVNSGTGATKGTKSLALSGLAYSTSYKIWVNATDPTGSGLYTRKWYTFTTQQQQNVPPNKPNKPTGQTNGKINVEYTYSTSTTDSNGDQVYYKWNWGDGTTSDWLGPNASGQISQAKHTWKKKGSYPITVKAKDIYGAESNWSDPLPITMPLSQNYVIGNIGALFRLILCFLRGEYPGLTFLQILRMEGWFT
jgi:hypothetical protein